MSDRASPEEKEVYTSNMAKTSQRRGAAEVGIRELRGQLSSYIARARAGESIVITDRGTPVAQLAGLSDVPPGLRRMIREGLVTPPSRPKEPAELGRRVRIEGGSQALIDEQRR